MSNCTGNDSRKIYKKILFFHFLPRSTELKAEVSFPISVLSHQVWGRRECVCVCVCWVHSWGEDKEECCGGGS